MNRRLYLFIFLFFSLCLSAQQVVPMIGEPFAISAGSLPSFVNSNIAFNSSSTLVSLSLVVTAGNFVDCYGWANTSSGTFTTMAIVGTSSTFTQLAILKPFTSYWSVGSGTIVASTTTEIYTLAVVGTGTASITLNGIACQQYTGTAATVGAAVETFCTSADTVGTTVTTVPCTTPGSSISFTTGDAISQFINIATGVSLTWTPGNSLTLDRCFSSCTTNSLGASAYKTNVTSPISPTWGTTTAIHFWMMMAFAIKGP